MSQPSYYHTALNDLDNKAYKQAVKGFKQCISANIQTERAVMGLISSYACMGKYHKASKVFDRNVHQLVFKTVVRHEFTQFFSKYLIRDFEAIKQLRNGYFSSIRLNRSMNHILNVYLKDKTHLYALIVLSYWYIMMGKRPKDSTDMLKKCLNLPTLDNDFRWKLLNRLSIGNKELLSDSQITSKFNGLPKDIQDTQYINELVLSPMRKEELSVARKRLLEARKRDVSLQNETMFNYVKLCVEQKDIDDTAVLLAKVLVSNGWVNQFTVKVIEYASKNQTKYTVEREQHILAYFNQNKQEE